jgi:hypothetical protein
VQDDFLSIIRINFNLQAETNQNATESISIFVTRNLFPKNVPSLFPASSYQETKGDKKREYKKT